MVKMAALAPKGVFEEEEEVRVWPWEEEPQCDRRFDDWTRNCDAA